jgi:hypothetical protein
MAVQTPISLTNVLNLVVSRCSEDAAAVYGMVCMRCAVISTVECLERQASNGRFRVACW